MENNQIRATENQVCTDNENRDGNKRFYSGDLYLKLTLHSTSHTFQRKQKGSFQFKVDWFSMNFQGRRLYFLMIIKSKVHSFSSNANSHYPSLATKLYNLPLGFGENKKNYLDFQV